MCVKCIIAYRSVQNQLYQNSFCMLHSCANLYVSRTLIQLPFCRVLIVYGFYVNQYFIFIIIIIFKKVKFELACPEIPPGISSPPLCSS